MYRSSSGKLRLSQYQTVDRLRGCESTTENCGNNGLGDEDSMPNMFSDDELREANIVSITETARFTPPVDDNISLTLSAATRYLRTAREDHFDSRDHSEEV